MASSTTCYGGWLLTNDLKTPTTGDEPAGPLPKPSLKLTGVFAAVVLAGLAFGWVLDGVGNAAVAVTGEPAPDFTVELVDGGTFTLSEQLSADDRPVVLNLWASWCVPCRVETPDISAFAEANPDVKVIGVAVNDTESGTRQFAAEFAPAYDLALGTPEFEAAYPRLGLPATYIIGADGVVERLWNSLVTAEFLEDLTG